MLCGFTNIPWKGMICIFIFIHISSVEEVVFFAYIIRYGSARHVGDGWKVLTN